MDMLFRYECKKCGHKVALDSDRDETPAWMSDGKGCPVMVSPKGGASTRCGGSMGEPDVETFGQADEYASDDDAFDVVGRL